MRGPLFSAGQASLTGDTPRVTLRTQAHVGRGLWRGYRAPRTPSLWRAQRVSPEQSRPVQGHGPCPRPQRPICRHVWGPHLQAGGTRGHAQRDTLQPCRQGPKGCQSGGSKGNQRGCEPPREPGQRTVPSRRRRSGALEAIPRRRGAMSPQHNIPCPDLFHTPPTR